MDYDVQLSAIYVNEKKTDSFPKKDSNAQFEKIECSNNAYANFNPIDWSLTIGNLKSGSTCEIFFTKPLNPETGSFTNILLTISIIIITAIAIKKIFSKYKFFKI